MKQLINKKILLLSILLLNVFAVSAQSTPEAKKVIELKHGSHRTGKRTDTAMQKWRDYGLGQFIHFGLYSMLNGEYNGKYVKDVKGVGGASEWIRGSGIVPVAVYDSLYKQFDPKDFDADKWAAMAKQMGVRYVTITTRHHDGFCLWPSKYSDYTIAKTPYKKDMIGPLVKAYNKVGIDVVLYYSILDWHSPDWRSKLNTQGDTIAFNRFRVFVKDQLTELLTLYPTIKGFWFDGTWDTSWASAYNGPYTDSLEIYLNKIHPGLICGGRYRVDEYGKRHDDSNGNLMGDYAQGWERKIPSNFEATKGRDWECDMTFGENGWGYQKKWPGHWKTTDELLEMLAKCVSMDGNFVLNFGPRSDGTFRPEEVGPAKEIGNWMKINSEAIYNAGYTGWEVQNWGYSTISSDGKKAYLLVFNVPTSGVLRVLTHKNQQIEKAYLNYQQSKPLLTISADYGYQLITIPKTSYQKPFVVALDIKNGNSAERQESHEKI
jgi:alpha-L-fucosidase